MKIYITGLPSGYEVEHLVRLFYPMAPLTLTAPEDGEDCVWAEKRPDKLWAMVRQGGKSIALVLGRVFRRVDMADAVGPGLHLGKVPGGDVLDAQFVCRRQQGREAGVHRGDSLCGQRLGVEGGTLDAKGLCGLFCGLYQRLFFGRELHDGTRYRKALLLQNAHNNAAVHSAVHADKHLVLCFVGVEPVAGQKCVAHVPCLPPCALLCATASWSQRSFSGWPAWPFTQT